MLHHVNISYLNLTTVFLSHAFAFVMVQAHNLQLESFLLLSLWNPEISVKSFI
jgi:hypothetical protein